MEDPAGCVINAAICAMKEAFAPASNPLGGGSEVVRFFAAEPLPLAVWNAYTVNDDCSQPFLWVRFMNRYRSTDFPAIHGGAGRSALPAAACPAPKAISLELGVARCAVTAAEPDWDGLQREAEISLDDSWRLELAQCRAAALAARGECADQHALDSVLPVGPDGGVIAWTAVLYFQLG